MFDTIETSNFRLPQQIFPTDELIGSVSKLKGVLYVLKPWNHVCSSLGVYSTNHF